MAGRKRGRDGVYLVENTESLIINSYFYTQFVKNHTQVKMLAP